MRDARVPEAMAQGVASAAFLFTIVPLLDIVHVELRLRDVSGAV